MGSRVSGGGLEIKKDAELPQAPQLGDRLNYPILLELSESQNLCWAWGWGLQ